MSMTFTIPTAATRSATRPRAMSRYVKVSFAAACAASASDGRLTSTPRMLRVRPSCARIPWTVTTWSSSARRRSCSGCRRTRTGRARCPADQRRSINLRRERPAPGCQRRRTADRRSTPGGCRPPSRYRDGRPPSAKHDHWIAEVAALRKVPERSRASIAPRSADQPRDADAAALEPRMKASGGPSLRRSRPRRPRPPPADPPDPAERRPATAARRPSTVLAGLRPSAGSCRAGRAGPSGPPGISPRFL